MNSIGRVISGQPLKREQAGSPKGPVAWMAHYGQGRNWISNGGDNSTPRPIDE